MHASKVVCVSESTRAPRQTHGCVHEINNFLFCICMQGPAYARASALQNDYARMKQVQLRSVFSFLVLWLRGSPTATSQGVGAAPVRFIFFLLLSIAS
jgi:hypothetical protein